MIMRPIETESFASLTVPPNLGPAPDLRWIKVAQLVVDDSYQRPLNSQGSRTNVRAIAEAFDWRRFAPVIVSPIVGGRYAIVDGQHRTTAAALCGIEEVPCNVIIADRIEQAKAFEAINSATTKVTAHQLFRARLAAGDEKARTIDALTAACGIEVQRSNIQMSKLQPNQTVAIKALYRLLDKFGEDVLRRCLEALVASAQGMRGALRAIIITAVVHVLADHREWLEHAGLHHAMQEIDVVSAEEDARERAIRVRGTTTLSNLEATLISHLAKALPR